MAENEKTIRIVLDLINKNGTVTINAVNDSVKKLIRSLRNLDTQAIKAQKSLQNMGFTITSAAQKSTAGMSKLDNQTKKTDKSFKNAAQSAKSLSAHATTMSGSFSSGTTALGRLSKAVQFFTHRTVAANVATSKFKLELSGLESFFLSQGIKILALTKGYSYLNQSLKETEKYQGALVGLGSIARFAGEEVGASMKAASDLAADGLIDLQSAATGLKNLLARGFNLEESIQLLNRFKDSAAFGRQGTLTMSEAIRSATEGLKNENSILVDNAGVTKNVSKMWEEYARQLGKGARSLSTAEKRQAEFNGIMRETEGMVGNATKALDTLAGQNAQFDQQMKMTLVSLGTSLEPYYREWTKVKIFVLTAVKSIIASIELLSVYSSYYLEKLSLDIENYFKPLLTISQDLATGLAEGFKKGLIGMMQNAREGLKEALAGLGQGLKEGMTDAFENGLSQEEAKKYASRMKVLEDALEAEINRITDKFQGKIDLSHLLGKDSGARRKDLDDTIKGNLSVIDSAVTQSIEKIKTQIERLKTLYDRGEIYTSDYFKRRRELVTKQYEEEIEGLKKLLSQQTEAGKQARTRERILKIEGKLQRELIKLNEEEFKVKRKLSAAERELKASTADVAQRVAEAPGGPTGRTPVQELEAQLALETNALKLQHAEELAMLRERTDVADTEAQKQIEIRKLQALQQQEIEKMELDHAKQIAVKRIEMQSEVAGLISGIFGDLHTAFGKETHAFFYLEKAAALAEAIINTELAATKAMGVMGPAGIPMSTLIRARGMASVAVIAAQTIQGFAEGGPIRGKSPHRKADNIPIKATAGEFVQPVDAVQYYGEGFMEAIRRRMIPKNIFSGMNMPSLIKMPRFGFATGGMVAAGAGTSYSVNVPVNVSGVGGMGNLPGQLQQGIEDTVIRIMRREFN